MSLYHLTGAAGALSILTSREFELSMTDGLSAEEAINKNYPYFMSTMRTRSNAFATRNRDSEVFFVLDERKIRSKYKTEAVDYWKTRQHFESEERILSKKRTIPIRDILSAVSIRADDDTKSSTLRKVVLACIRQNIPLTIYETKADFLAQMKSRALPIGTDLLKKIAKPGPKESALPSFLQEIKNQNAARNRRDVSAWLSLLHAAANGRLGQLHKNTNKDLKKLLEDVPKEGSFIQRELQSDLNDRMLTSQTHGRGTRQMLYAQKLSELARKLDLNAKTVIPYIREKMADAAPISQREAA